MTTEPPKSRPGSSEQGPDAEAAAGSAHSRPPKPAGPWTRMTVQHQITIAVAALSLLSLTLVGFLLSWLEAGNTSSRITLEMGQEISEVRTFADSGIDPATGEPFTDVDVLLTEFLSVNQPDADETLFAFLSDGRVLYQGQPGPLRDSQEFLDTVHRLEDTGGRVDLTVGDTDYSIMVLPVEAGAAAASGPNPEAAPASFAVVHDLSASRGELGTMMRMYTVAAAASALLIVGIAFVVSRRLLRPIKELNETAQGIRAGSLSARLEVTGNDDVAELTRTFNDMLDRLEAAFEGQKQFLDDAGHELRTPLTIIRGHLELVDVDDPADVAETRAILLDEADRMARLVDDLLILARSRRPDFVQPTRIDSGDLVEGVLAKARGLGDRTWVADRIESTEFLGDHQRLTQGLLQLADNAVEHTQPGDEIGIGTRVSEGEVRFWVRDTGPGVPEEIADTIFERFQRGRTDGKGFGLGLAILRAIATAHHGRVELVRDPAGHPALTCVGDPAAASAGTGKSATGESAPASAHGAKFVIVVPRGDRGDQ